jgi:stearoyl-CoA desaturase (delta-9 desaturase)
MSIKLLKIKPRDKPEDGKQEQQHKTDADSERADQPVGDATDGLSTEAVPEDSAAKTRATEGFEAPLVWRNIILFVILHSSIPIALMMLADPQKRPHWQTVVWMYFTAYISGLGITGGAHRLWSHRAYKARLPIEAMLMVLQTMAGQNSIYTWCRDHRVHHKFSETDADPHNIKRGFFFAHMGWLCCRKHPEVREKGASIDMSDLESNPVVMFQHKHFWWLAILFTVMLPTMVPVWLWHERFWTSFVFCFMLRYLVSLHSTWLVNSAAHYHGPRPYDGRIEARESPWVIIFGLGEGFHNYHHTFPFDYSTSEFGKYFNVTTAFIDLFAAMGLVYDLRKVDKETIRSRQERTGEKPKPAGSSLECSDGRRGDELDVAKRLASSFNIDYISDTTSLKYTM